MEVADGSDNEIQRLFPVSPAAPPNKPLQRTGAPQGNRVESRRRLGGAPAAERQSVRQTSQRGECGSTAYVTPFSPEQEMASSRRGMALGSSPTRRIGGGLCWSIKLMHASAIAFEFVLVGMPVPAGFANPDPDRFRRVQAQQSDSRRYHIPILVTKSAPHRGYTRVARQTSPSCSPPHESKDRGIGVFRSLYALEDRPP